MYRKQCQISSPGDLNLFFTLITYHIYKNTCFPSPINTVYQAFFANILPEKIAAQYSYKLHLYYKWVCASSHIRTICISFLWGLFDLWDYYLFLIGFSVFLVIFGAFPFGDKLVLNRKNTMWYHVGHNEYLFNRPEQHNIELVVMLMYAEGSIETSANLRAGESWRTRKSCPHNLWSFMKFKYTLSVPSPEYAIY